MAREIDRHLPAVDGVQRGTLPRAGDAAGTTPHATKDYEYSSKGAGVEPHRGFGH